MHSPHYQAFSNLSETHHLILYPFIAFASACVWFCTARLLSKTNMSSLGGGVVLAAVTTRFWRYDESRPRSTLATLLLVAWAVRLSWFMYQRGVLSSERALNPADTWLPRALFALAATTPVALINAIGADPGWPTTLETCYAVVAVAALVLEAVADRQKSIWHTQNKELPKRDDNVPPVCNTGLWRLSRHPNYFATIIFHTSLWAFVHNHVPWTAIVGPAFVAIVLLFMDGGAVSIEQARNYDWAFYSAYDIYRRTTSPIVPMPPCLWQTIPRWVTHTFLCELPAYSRTVATQL
jgi:steroid 5-alpha reductase family enzyme